MRVSWLSTVVRHTARTRLSAKAGEAVGPGSRRQRPPDGELP
jgi:hypothetical protein